MDNCFGRHYRLLKTDDFSSVFALRRQRSRSLLQVLESNNNQLGHARLGLVVSKKAAKRAHDRNYMKRLIREWFRHNRHQLPPKDFVVRVRQGFGRSQYAEIQQQLSQLMLHR